MKKLILKNSLVDSLNLSKTMEVDSVYILINKDLQYVELGGCTSMRYTRISDIPVVSLNLSNLPELNYINLITLQRLNDLRTDNDAKLQHLMTFGLSSLKTVNVASNPALRRLYLENAYAINAIDVTRNPKLKHIRATYCYSLKTVDFSKNDSLASVTFDDSGIDTLDFSNNPNLYAVTMFRVPIRNLSLLANPKVCVLSLDGCVKLKTLDLRSQKNFDFYYVPTGDLGGMSQDDMYQVYQDGYFSPVATAQYHAFGQATRKGVNGATADIFAGLRVPQYLDASGLSLTQIKLNKAVKDNYSLVMARRVFGSMTPVLVTVYDDDKTTLLCQDYDPLLFKCN
jgi:hypothetical protein